MMKNAGPDVFALEHPWLGLKFYNVTLSDLSPLIPPSMIKSESSNSAPASSFFDTRSAGSVSEATTLINKPTRSCLNCCTIS